MEPGDSPLAFRVPVHGRNMRLDAALALFLPQLGLRGRRRLWDWHRITVNSRPRPPGFVVFPGDLIRVETVPDNTALRDGRADGPPHGRKPVPAPEFSGVGPRLVAANNDFAAFHKPPGLHSAHIAGGREPSLEGLLAEHWARIQRESGLAVPSSDSLPLLLTRLDAATSGIILAAMNGGAAQRFRLAAQRGEVSKTYFAVLRGRLLRPLEIRNRLDTNRRKLTLVLDEEEPDSARHTLVTPLADAGLLAGEEIGLKCGTAGEENGLSGATLVRVRIKRGARHQIRAHLAWAGFSLAGEWLYPIPVARRPDMRLYLHHAKVEFSGFSALDMPGWNLGESLEQEPSLKSLF